ncbi:Uncharacterized protein APZ42_022217 [Daphnia magna]|uniref:Uncharacterized protein n=1 Tax=Daphnia magna TaxID=35525 RepID=A0A164W3W5_9CRUS|nr:Uncharacterized protein APZ42_022217 [Daphnia magna]
MAKHVATLSLDLVGADVADRAAVEIVAAQEVVAVAEIVAETVAGEVVVDEVVVVDTMPYLAAAAALAFDSVDCNSPYQME